MQRLGDMEIAGHEGIVGRAEPALARGVGPPFRRVERLPAAVDLAREAQLVRHGPGRVAVARAQAAAAEGGAVRIGERPLMLARALLHDGVEPLGRHVALARLGLAQGESGSTVMPAWPSGQTDLPSSSSAIGG